MARDQATLFTEGCALMVRFCEANGLSVPECHLSIKEEWQVGPCAYYRPNTELNRKWTKPGINICIPKCAYPCGDIVARNWSWPGNVTDRTPYGVVCHELGHHADYWSGDKKYTYSSDYGERMKERAGEKGITSYAEENPAEWFAEAFRLFLTNPDLLRLLRPETFCLLRKDWEPVVSVDWRAALGNGVPARVVSNLEKKGAPHVGA